MIELLIFSFFPKTMRRSAAVILWLYHGDFGFVTRFVISASLFLFILTLVAAFIDWELDWKIARALFAFAFFPTLFATATLLCLRENDR